MKLTRIIQLIVYNIIYKGWHTGDVKLSYISREICRENPLIVYV